MSKHKKTGEVEGVIDYLKLANEAATRFLRQLPNLRHLTQDVFAQAKLILVQETPNYDPDLGAPSTFFITRIQLRLIDWLRTLRPKGINRRSKKADPVVERLPTGRQPPTHRRPVDDSPLARADGAIAGVDTRDLLERVRQLAGKGNWPVIVQIVEGRTLVWLGEQLGLSESGALMRRRAVLRRLRDAIGLEELLREKL